MEVIARGHNPPAYPVSFIKAPACIAGWNEDIPIPKLAQEDQCDYEGELVCLLSALSYFPSYGAKETQYAKNLSQF